MLTVLESIRLSTEYLQKKGIESPRINAEMLLAHILNCKRLDLYLSFDRPLTEEETAQYREFLKRRSENEPVQYIIGSVEFFGLPFEVNPSVLIPRQDTETLVEAIINNTKDKGEFSLLDIGTGSGNIAISLARNLPGIIITATDTSDKALKVAEHNAELNGVADRISFINNDILNSSSIDGIPFDLIVSNPPYIALNEYQTLEPELRMHEPKTALTDNGDGLLFYRKILERSDSLLKKGGLLFFEIGQGQHVQVSSLFKKSNFININIQKDYTDIERVIYGEKS